MNLKNGLIMSIIILFVAASSVLAGLAWAG